MPIVYGPVKSKKIRKKVKAKEEKTPTESENDEAELVQITLKHTMCDICYSRFKVMILLPGYFKSNVEN